MNPDHSAADRDRLEELFDRAADLPAEERAAFAARHCSDNDSLRAELLRLLATLDHEDLLQSAVPTAATGTAIGTKIGPYRLLEVLGEGGMGTVYAAEQVVPIARKVALKVIKCGMDTAQVVARFEAERQALARMTHPNVAQVYDGGCTADGRPYFAMELVDGSPVNVHCDDLRLTTRQRLELFLRICDGVQHAHAKGLIHRDLKPSNVLVTRLDGVDVPKVIDFGIARATTGSLTEQTLHTQLGQVLGTLDYMSPEQADPGSADIDIRSDVYSLGVVLYQLLSGLLPFAHLTERGVSLSELQRAILETDPPPPSTGLRQRAAQIAPLHGADERTLVKQLAGDLDWICLKALAKDPADRYQTIAALAADVRRHLADQPITAGRPSMMHRTRKFVRRHRVAVAVTAVVAGALAVSIGGIVAGGIAATARAAELLGLSDERRLQQLVDAADALWPPYPEKLPAMRRWTKEAQGLFANLEQHREHLAAMRARGERIADEAAGATATEATWRFATTEDQWYHEQLGQLVVHLEEFGNGLLADDAITAEHGWSVAKRECCARELAVAFAADGVYGKAWAEAMPAIQAAYPGFALAEPMRMGLVPLGCDPTTGLWEFAHVISGELPTRDAAGQLVRTDGTGIVLVLLPGNADFVEGTQQTDPDGANYDAFASEFAEEVGLTAAPMQPFLLSKYEMTRSQWHRFAATKRGQGNSEVLPPQDDRRPRSPMNVVTWNQCTQMMRRLGLVLPSSAQWEYGARGGTTTTWWWGRDHLARTVVENIHDLCSHELRPTWRSLEDVAQWRDPLKEARFAAKQHGPAPVGSYPANGFGLHDVAGNVTEWTSTGAKKSALLKVARGGNLQEGWRFARSATRLHGPATFLDPALGLRPAMELVERSGN